MMVAYSGSASGTLRGSIWSYSGIWGSEVEGSSSPFSSNKGFDKPNVEARYFFFLTNPKEKEIKK